MRLFFALPLNAVLQQAVSSIIEDLRQQFPSSIIRWEPLQRLHLTIRFLGSTDPAKLAELITTVSDNLAQHHAKIFDLSLGGLRLFPTENPRMIILATQLTPELHDLFQWVDMSVRHLGFAPETRAFVPHITLARFKTLPTNLAAKNSLPTVEIMPLVLPVQELVLFQSHAIAAGSHYHALHRFSLLERCF